MACDSMSCYRCIHCTQEEAELGMYYCLVTLRLIDDGFGNGDAAVCKKYTPKRPPRWDEPFGGEILIGEEDGHASSG